MSMDPCVGLGLGSLCQVMFVRVVAEYPTAASSALAIAVSLSLSVFVASECALGLCAR